MGMEEWAYGEESHAKALAEICQRLIIREEDWLGEAGAARGVKNPCHLPALADQVHVRSLEARRAGWAVEPVDPLQHGETRASGPFHGNILHGLVILTQGNDLVAVCHVQQSGICRGCKPGRQKENCIAKPVEREEG